MTASAAYLPLAAWLSVFRILHVVQRATIELFDRKRDLVVRLCSIAPGSEATTFAQAGVSVLF